MSKTPRVLLIQVRELGSEMALHELASVDQRLAAISAQLTARNVFAEAPSAAWLDNVDALIIGGSGSFSVQDPRSRFFVSGLRSVIDRAFRDELPSFGICFGHQLVGQHLGSRVITDVARRETGTLRFELTPAGLTDPVFSHLGRTFTANTGHTDFVTETPRGASLLARSASIECQAMHVVGTRFHTSQFHPDLTAQGARERYDSFAAGLPEQERHATEADKALFDPSVDDAAQLLARFVSVGCEPPAKRP